MADPLLSPVGGTEAPASSKAPGYPGDAPQLGLPATPPKGKLLAPRFCLLPPGEWGQSGQPDWPEPGARGAGPWLPV